MKTKEEKFSEFHRDLEGSKKYTVWMLIILFIGCIMITEYFIHWTLFTIPFRGMNYFVGLYMLMFFIPIIRKINMKKRSKELKEDLQEREKELSTLKEEYIAISSYKFGDIPPNLRATAIYLLSNGGERELLDILRKREQGMEEDTIRLQVYLQSPERNFFWYLISWKWLKKIPK